MFAGKRELLDAREWERDLAECTLGCHVTRLGPNLLSFLDFELISALGESRTNRMWNLEGKIVRSFFTSLKASASASLSVDSGLQRSC